MTGLKLAELIEKDGAFSDRSLLDRQCFNIDVRKSVYPSELNIPVDQGRWSRAGFEQIIAYVLGVHSGIMI